MDDKKLIVTTTEGVEIPVIMAPPGHGAGVSFIIPNLLLQASQVNSDVATERRSRGYTKPKAWPTKR